MPANQSVREQLFNSFRAEISEHLQTMNDGLLALEQTKQTGPEREATLYDVFRAAHSLKGAARTMGAVSIQQLAHKLEDVLDGLRKGSLEPSAELYNACYKALEAIRLVHSVYDAG